MTNPYIEKIMKKRKLSLVSGGFSGESVMNSSIKPISPTSPDVIKGGILGMKSSDEDKAKKLANTIVSSIQKAFDIMKLKEKVREIDLQKISKLVIEKPVKLNFGGGLLVFGPDLKVSSMIHVFNKENQPFYFEKKFSSSLEPNTVNEGLQSDKKYDAKSITSLHMLNTHIYTSEDLYQ
jgi:hypothetical protein